MGVRIAERDEHQRRFAETIAAYDSMAGTYASQFADTDLSAHHERFISALGYQAGTVLDAGCGAGRDCAALTKHGVRTVGLDLSSGLLREAAKIADAPLALGDVRMLPMKDEAFSGVWCAAVLLHSPPVEALRALRELRRVLRLGGPLFLSLQTQGEPGWRGAAAAQRWFEQYTPERTRGLLTRAGFVTQELGVEPDATRPEISWIAVHASRA